MPDYIYQQPQSQMGVETQAPPSAVPPVFMPSPTDIAAQNFYSSQESLVSQPPTPINYGQAPASGYRPGIDPPIQHVFDRVSTISPTADESGDIDEPLIDPSSIIPANQPVFFSPGGHGGQSKGTQGQTLGDTVFMRDGGMPKHAQQLAERGRYGDTTLVHMNPKEMAGIASLFPDQTITRNPDTGLPEMFDFMSILPTIAGIGASFFLGPVGAAAVSGITTAITTKDVGKGVMAGLMSYGLGSLMGAGSESATQAATAADAAVQAGTSAGTDAATQAAITSGQLAPNVSVGPGVGPGVGPAGAIDVSALTGTNLAGPTALDISALSGTNPSSPAMQGLPGTADAFKPALSGEGSMFNEIYSPSRSGMLSEKQFMDPYFRPGASVDPSPQSVAGPPVSFNASPASFSADEIPSNALRSEGGILEGSRQKISDTAEMLTDRTYFDLADTPGYTAEGGDDAARALGFRSVGDLAGPAMYAGMGAYGTIAPMLEPDPYEYQPPEKRSYGSVRAIPESEYRVPSSAPVGYDPTTQGEWSYYGNEGGIVRNLPTIYAKSGYGGNQAAAALQEVIAGNAPRTPLQSQGMGNNPPSQAAPPQAVKSSFNPQNVLQLMGKYMPSAYAAEGGLGKTAEALALGAGIGATETIPDHVISEAIETAKKYGATDEEINKTPTSKLPDLARQYKSMSTEGSPIVTDRVTGKEYTGAPPIEKQAGGIAGVIEEEIPMGAEEVATIGIMEGAPEAIQDGVRDEAMLNEPSDPQNAEERAIYDRAILALGGELEPSTAQKAIDEYIEVFGAQAYRALKKMVNQPREAGGIVKPANGETTVPNGELQGEDIIAGKIVDSVTGQEKANLRVAENEYIKTGQDLSNQALANGLPPTPENGAMVEGMEEEALRRAFG
tara:strand:- start:497 stop:3187 length:2691 start_codon:yes stop_codon:yes gene_type:complete